MVPVIKTCQVRKKFKRSLAVNQASLTVCEGDIYGLIGQNGAGKTTIMRLIMGHIFPSSGSLEIMGRADLRGLIEGRKKIGALIEVPSIIPNMSSEENLQYTKRLYGIRENRVQEILKLVSLDSSRTKKARYLSLGMKQRLAIGNCLLIRPKVLLLDEPMNGLDPQGIVEIRNLLLQLNQKNNTTILISSHILSELEQVATKYAFIHNGELIEEINKNELMQKCETYIRIKSVDAAKIKILLEEKINLLDSIAVSDAEIQIHGSNHLFNQIQNCLSENKIAYHHMSIQSASLEEYYMKKTGGQKHEKPYEI